MGGGVHLLLTDPPYNVDYEGGTEQKLKITNDDLSENAFKKLLLNAFTNAKEHLVSGGAFYIFHPDGNGLTFREICEEVGLHVRQCLIWVKNTFVMGRQDYQWQHEPCLYGWKEGAHYFTKDRTQSTVFEDDVVCIRNGSELSRREVSKLIKE